MQKNLDYLRAYTEIGAHRQAAPRALPLPVLAHRNHRARDGKIVAVKLERNELRPAVSGDIKASGTGQFETIPAGLILRSVGYKGSAAAGRSLRQAQRRDPQ
jgi:ferredoxin--NADP+ reductase